MRSMWQQRPSMASVAVFSFNILLSLFLAPPAVGQDSPGRFEIGGSLTTLRGRGISFSENLGPGLEGDFNIGRHFALDAALDWFPSNSLLGHTAMGLFGGKAGTRTKHFGFFGKIRPGFLTVDNSLREDILVENNIGIPISIMTRFDRLTERALDVGGVIEYYPSRHWALRYDLGDTLVFEEPIKVTVIGGVPIAPPPVFRVGTSNHFQFSASVHYRF